MISFIKKDTLLAVKLFSVSLIFLLISASVDLTSLPGKPFLALAMNPSLKFFIEIFSGYSLIISVLFWGSRPSFRSQLYVFILWPITTIILWLSLNGDLEFSWFGDADFDMIMLLGTGMGIPSLVALVWRVWRPGKNSEPYIESNFRWLLLMVFLFILVPQSALDMTVSLHPKTYDFFALRFDAAAGIDITPWLYSTVEKTPGLGELLELAYGLTPLAFVALTLIQLRNHPAYLPNALLLWVVMTFCALIAYHFFPITGPKYVFGSNNFLSALQTPENWPLELTSGAGPNPRNGMPSMHFGWMLAALLIWTFSGTRRLSQMVLVAMTFCVALATLFLGEHYVIDLLIAVPFVLAAIALCTTGVPWSSVERRLTVALGFGCWLIWIFLLRTQINFFIHHPWACWLMIIATIITVAFQVKALSNFRALAVTRSNSPSDDSNRKSISHITRQMGLMFFISGIAALVYQVLFAKELALVFGSTATATFTVLATFLGGMAIGSLLGSILAARISRPLVAYAIVEVAIATFCIATPVLFTAIQKAYVLLAVDITPASPVLLILRVSLGAGVLLIPTILMGITLPLLAQALKTNGNNIGHSVAWLYACNTAGAALGALLTSYFVIPALGVSSTTLVAALLNLLVALAALELSKKLISSATSHRQFTRNESLNPVSRLLLISAWFSLGLGGLFSLGLEVVYIHLLSIVAGNSVYAFGLMLATFLVGLAIGGECGRRLIDNPKTDRAAWLTAIQITLAGSVALSTWGWDMIPSYFASFSGYPVITSFSSREAIRGIVCALVMIPPTICIGLSYALAMDITTSSEKRSGIKILGLSAAINTFGNIAGVLLFGFFLLPWFGGLVSTKIVAIGALAIAAFVMLSIKNHKKLMHLGTAMAAVISLVIISPTRLDYESLSSGANVYFSAQKWGTVIDHAESIDGGLTTVVSQSAADKTIKTLLTNGKFQGNDAISGEVQAQIGFAALPLIHQGNRQNALVIGYGTGVTSRVFYDAGFEHIDISELSNDIVTLADIHFSSINSQVSKQAGVKTHITDGRNLLLLTKNQYDIVSIEISSIWFAGAASLYNREFYQLARRKMKPDGVLQQWVQLHHMESTDLLTIIGTLRSEFNFVSLYVVGGQGILIATNSQANSNYSPNQIAELDNSPKLEPVRELAGRSFSDISGDLLLSPPQVDILLKDIGLDISLWISTDNNLRLEYNTPKANANPHDQSFEKNINMLNSVRN